MWPEPWGSETEKGMNVEQLYENQYARRQLVKVKSSPVRKTFVRFGLNREELALSLLDEGRRLLDVGCGSGSLMFGAREKFDELYGVDVSAYRVDEAERKAREQFGDAHRLHFLVANADDKLDFPDEMFDAVTSIAVIEHVFDPYAVIGEMHRVLRPGGILVVQVPNIAYIKHRIHLLLGKLPVTASPHNWREIGWDGGHLHHFTLGSLRELLQEMGFRVLKVRGSGLFSKVRGLRASLLTGDLCLKAQKCSSSGSRRGSARV
jgi:2-polyprenyl-3-methyl-5-hydroxy-6-metoxy-1,4-benzoquinol methylase